ncbi:MAG: SGNH/GDSL hydrolase family protein [Actinomycetota bacterium]
MAGVDGDGVMSDALAERMRGLRLRCAANPGVCWLIGFGMLVVGGVVFRSSTSVRNLFVAVLVALAAAALGGFGLLLINEPIRAFVDAGRGRAIRVGFGLLLAGLLAVAAAVWVGTSIGVIVAAVVVLVALLIINAWLVGDDRTAVEFLGPGLALLVLATLVIWAGDGLDAFALIGVGLWVLGLVFVKVGLPPWIDADLDRRRVPALVAAVAETALGVAFLVWASRASTQILVLIGVGLVVLGLSAVGIALARFEPGPPLSYLVFGIGLVALAAGVLLTWQTLRLPELVLLGAAVVAAIGAWFVFRGEALVAVLLLGFVFAWVVVDRTADEPRDPNPDAELSIVAFGDSYISGEGAPRYFADTNVPGLGNNACRRAPTAYPWVVADRLDASLLFLACSGARTVDMDNTPEPRPLPIPLGLLPGGEDQVQRLLASFPDRIDATDAVLVSIGGNDVFFGNIVQACLLPQTCAVDDRVGPWLDDAREVEDTLVDTYTLLRTVFGADTPIVAVPYPQVVAPVDGCRIVVDDDEIEFVRQFTSTLNGAITRAAERAGINVYPFSEDAFVGRGLCDDDPATNSLHLSPTEGSFLAELSPANWVHGSMHPRASGHELIADGMVSDPADGPVDGWLVDLLASDTPNPEPAGGEDVGPIGEPPEVADRDWVTDRLYETIGDLVLPLGLLLLGGLLAAYGALLVGIPIVRFVAPTND